MVVFVVVRPGFRVDAGTASESVRDFVLGAGVSLGGIQVWRWDTGLGDSTKGVLPGRVIYCLDGLVEISRMIFCSARALTISKLADNPLTVHSLAVD